MIKKIVIILITTLTLTVNVYAGSDGELILKKNEPSEISDCSETFNRASFALNQGLDKIIFKPVASVYRVLPSPVKTGVSNSLNNLSNVVTIPNNILQGEFALAGLNTGRFVINTTIGVLGLIAGAIMVVSMISVCIRARIENFDCPMAATAFVIPFGIFFPLQHSLQT